MTKPRRFEGDRGSARSADEHADVASCAAPIPPVAHFIWYGERFPWVNVLAIRSALERGGFERAVLHCDRDLRGVAALSELYALPRFELRVIEPAAFEPLGEDGRALATLHDGLRSPAARANVLRAVLLAVEGGVYLDMDTVTVRSLDTLRAEGGVFCGSERIAFPAALWSSLDPLRWSRALSLSALRAVCRRLPAGYRHFRNFERFYATAANNAVLGAAPGHPFVRALLTEMLALSPARRRVRFALGTHLLQRTLARLPMPDVRVLPPAYFFPLGPEISRHWFAARGAADLHQILQPQTHVVHWYASVENAALVARIDADYVRAHCDERLFCALAAPFVS